MLEPPVGASLAIAPDIPWHIDRPGRQPVDGVLAFAVRAGILVRLSGHPVHRSLAPEVLIQGVLDMAAVCDICGKGPGFGKSVSHSHRRTSRRWNPNIQSVRAVTRPGGNKKRINVCTSCLKAGKVTRG
jgi:large subunit ribosomal protein L28